MAAGAELDTITILTAAHQKHINKGLAETIQRNIELVGMPEWTEEEMAFARSLQKTLGAKETGYPDKLNPIGKPSAIQVGGGSTDVGEVSLIAPTATLAFPGQVPYAGKPLQSGGTYNWKVRYWDSQGQASPFSDTASFGCGLFSPADWTGQWIGGKNQLRKEFSLPKKVVRARASNQRECRRL